jgi:hypothetical protein
MINGLVAPPLLVLIVLIANSKKIIEHPTAVKEGRESRFVGKWFPFPDEFDNDSGSLHFSLPAVSRKASTSGGFDWWQNWC